jgi:hypothetical protein
MTKASWILLTLVGVITLLGSLGSLYTAYAPGTSARDDLGRGTSVQDVEAWRPEVAKAIKARRGTAAAFAAAYAVLFLSVVLGPYRRGDAWSWWALLAGAVTLGLLIALRIPALGTRVGAGTGIVQLAVVLVALLLDVRRVRAAPAPAPAAPTR